VYESQTLPSLFSLEVLFPLPPKVVLEVPPPVSGATSANAPHITSWLTPGEEISSEPGSRCPTPGEGCEWISSPGSAGKSEKDIV